MPQSSSLTRTLNKAILFLSLVALCWGQTQTTTSRPSTSTYIVKFFKANPSQLQNIDSGIILTQIQFLEKLVRNTASVLNQAVFYVNFTVQVPTNVNSSNVATNKNAITGTNSNTPTPLKSTPSPPLPVVAPTPKNPDPLTGISDARSSSNTNAKTMPDGLNNKSRNLGPSGTFISSNSSGQDSLNISLVNSRKVQGMSSSSLSSSPQTTTNNTDLKIDSILNPFRNSPSARKTILSIQTQIKKQPKPNNKIMNTEFPGIGLYHNLPTNFIQNQVYKFEGILTNPSMVFIQDTVFNDANFVNIIFSQVEGDEEVKCIDRVSKKKLEFQTSCKLRLSGAFYISIFSGNSGYSSNIIRNVFSPAIRSAIGKSSEIPVKPQNLYIELIQGDLYIKWSSRSPLTKIQFSQDSQTLQFILSNYHQRFLVPYAQFRNFDETNTNITISHANSKQDTLYGITSMFGDMMQVQINAVQHMHANNNQNAYQLKAQISQQMALNSTLNFAAVFRVPAQNQVFIVSPYNQITKLYFDSRLKNANAKTGNGNSVGGLIQAGVEAKFNYTFEEEGVYLLQINEQTGLAIINQPIYVGYVFPLLPDYIDIKIQSILDKTDLVTALEQYVQSLYPKQAKFNQPPKTSSLESKRNYMLILLNLLRTKQIINPVYVDNRLTTIAQNHSNDMALNNYFSHNNLKGEGPGERAKNFGFFFAIGENVAQSASLTEAHLSLQRSAAHFQNSINKIWTRVGIGINQTTFGQYLVTFEFSSRDIQLEPLSKAQLEDHQQQLVAMIKRKFPTIKSQQTQVSNLILEWMVSTRNFPLAQYLLSKGRKQLMTNNSIKFTYYPNFVQQIEKSEGLFGDAGKFNRMGVNIGLSKGDNTIIQCYFVFLQA